MGFGLHIGFIGHFNTPLVITLNYSAEFYQSLQPAVSSLVVAW
jgi:hypothetical protein